MKLLASLIALMSMSLSLAAAPKFPFPQKAAYKFGIIPKDVDHDKVQAVFNNFMKHYDEQGDLARIKYDNPDLTVSEGIGYGMLVMVYMDNEKNNTQGKFDKLWNYYNKFLGPNGLMNWQINGFSSAAKFGAATDAEIDVAIALLQAYKQWGDEKYLNDAKTIIGKMAEHEVNDNGYLKPGDSWDNKKNPSYFSTAALEMFKDNSDFDWANVLAKSYELLKKSQNATTGLIPDWCAEDGKAVDGDRFYYDASRAPWRIAWAHSWFGHQDAKDICTKMASWITTKTGGDPEKIVTGYNLDGTELDEWHNATFVGPFVCAGMVDASHQEWVDKGYAHLVDMKESVYFQVSMQMLTVLYTSGNMPNLWEDIPIGVERNNVHDKTAASSSSFTTTSIKGVSSVNFILDKPVSVALTLYSFSGVCVGTVSTREYAAGSHNVVLGNRLSSGAYIVRMNTASGELTKRLTVSR